MDANDKNTKLLLEAKTRVQSGQLFTTIDLFEN